MARRVAVQVTGRFVDQMAVLAREDGEHQKYQTSRQSLSGGGARVEDPKQAVFHAGCFSKEAPGVCCQQMPVYFIECDCW